MGLLNNKKKNNISKIKITNTEELLQELINDYSTSAKQIILMNVRNEIITKAEFEADVKENIAFMYDIDEETEKAGISLFFDYIFGYSKLTPLINDPEISDIRCISFDNIRVKRKGVRMDSGVKFSSPQEYEHFIDFVATKNQVNISNLNAIQRFADNISNDKYILRFTVSMPLVNTYDAPYLCIRKVPKDFPLIEDLIEAEMMTEEVANLLKSRFAKGSTLICGGNSSGKTTILNALKESLPDNMAVLVAQQADELTTKTHPDMMFLHSLAGNSESQALYDLKNISIAGLTMDVDFFIIGEVKGDEAMYLLNAAYTGQICAATIHAPSAKRAINKLIDYALVESRYTKKELLKMLDCFKTVIFMKNYKVCEVYAVNGYNEEKEDLEYRPIWENGKFVH